MDLELENTVENAAAILDVNPEEATYESKDEMSLELDDELLITDDGDLFDDLGTDDLLVAEKLIFAENEVVTVQVVDFSPMANKKGVNLDVKVIEGEHTGKLMEMTIWKPDPAKKWQKVEFKQFVNAIFTTDEIKKREMTAEVAIGRKFFMTAKEPYQSNKGDMRQNFRGYTMLNENTESGL